MTVAGSVLFVVTSLFAVLGAVMTVIARRVLRATIGLLVHIVSLAGLYLTLDAQFLAALQLLVYAGAVVVLFVFVIMLIGPMSEANTVGRALVSRVLGAASVFTIFLTIAATIVRFSAPWPETDGALGTIENLGIAIYQGAWFPFELMSITLLVAIIGAVAVARGRTDSEAELAVQCKSESTEKVVE